MKHLVIRDAGQKDIDGMLPLLEQLFAIEADFSFDPETQARGLFMMLDGCGKHRAVKLAEIEGEIIGMCTAQTRISTARGAVCATVEDLVVDRAFRGNGVGRKLLDAIQEWARKRSIPFLTLLADKNNAQGLEFYRKAAWQTTDLVCLGKPLE